MSYVISVDTDPSTGGISVELHCDIGQCPWSSVLAEEYTYHEVSRDRLERVFAEHWDRSHD